MKTALVLGGGFAGCTAAYLLHEKGFRVTLLESAAHPGGGAWTCFYGGHPYTFGPRVFFTRDEQVIHQLTKLVTIRRFETKTWTYVEKDGLLYHYPIQHADIPLMPDCSQVQAELDERQARTPSVDNFEAYWLSVIGPALYEKFVDGYSKKMWGVESNRQLNADFQWVNRGAPLREGDDRLYTDQFQGYPEASRGYNEYFEKCLIDCEVHFGCSVDRCDPDRRVVCTADGEFTGDVIVSSIYTDALFGFEYGQLRFCGRQFIPLWLPVENVFPEDVTWIHYSGQEEHTRVTEFKRITAFKSSSTLLGVEVPAQRGRHYPVQSPPELRRFESYKNMCPSDFFLVGRPAKFQYQGIADAIRDALDVAEAVR